MGDRLVSTRTSIGALMLAVFTVSAGYGVVLPLLPSLIETLVGPEGTAIQVSRHTGLLTAVYTLALFLFAPAWGRLSDRAGRRAVLLIGLSGFGGTMLLSSIFNNLSTVYVGRFLSGVFAAAVTPVASAAIGDLTTADELRGRRLAFLSMSGVAGFLLGPMVGVGVMRMVPTVLANAEPARVLAGPLVAGAVLSFVVSLVIGWAVPTVRIPQPTDSGPASREDGMRRVVQSLLVLSFIASTAVGVFEVGLALRGKQELGLGPTQIAVMFTECSLVMFGVQAAVFSPWLRAETTRWLMLPALLVLAGGLLLVPQASTFPEMLVVTGAVAASAGILSPILTYWISSATGSARGWQLGRQTAAASIGMTAGSVAGGWLFNISGRPLSFAMTAGLALLGAAISFGAARSLPLGPVSGASKEPT